MRYLTSPPYPGRRPDGTPQCKMCGTDRLERGRRCWCSQRCVDDYNVRAGNHIRGIVFQRDHGRCAQCGLNTDRYDKSLARLTWQHNSKAPRWRHLMALVGRPVDPHRTTCFDVDHIVPVIEGGGACGLDNLQTLCVWCHKRKTAEAARTR